jgi:hypothetical protein
LLNAQSSCQSARIASRTRNKHHRFSKEFLAGLLDPFNKTEIDISVTSEAREIDLLFTPQTGCDPSGLGLLGRIAQTPCIIEPPFSCPELTLLYDPFSEKTHMRRSDIAVHSNFKG